MNATMIFDYLKLERYEEALYSKQGLVSAYTFLRKRSHMLRGKSGEYQSLC